MGLAKNMSTSNQCNRFGIVESHATKGGESYIVSRRFGRVGIVNRPAAKKRKKGKYKGLEAVMLTKATQRADVLQVLTQG
jgi:hypothetical protein